MNTEIHFLRFKSLQATLLVLATLLLLSSCGVISLTIDRYSPDPAFVATAQKVEVVKTGFFRTFYTLNDPSDGSTIPFRVKKGWTSGQDMPNASFAIGETSVKNKFRVIDLRTKEELSVAALLKEKQLVSKFIDVSWGLSIKLEMFRGKESVGNLALTEEDGYAVIFDDEKWDVAKRQNFGSVQGWELKQNDSLDAILLFSSDGLFTDKYTIYFLPEKRSRMQVYATLLILLNETDNLERQLKSKIKE